MAPEESVAVVARPVEPRRETYGQRGPPHPAAERQMAGSRWWRRCRHEPQRRASCRSRHHKLNDTQLVILSSASQREDGFAVLPEGVRAASVKAAVIRLTKLGFLKQVRVKRDQPHWSSDEEGRRIGVKITNAGSAAIGVGDDGKGAEQPAPEPKRRVKKAAEPREAQREAAAPRGGSKRAQIIALMQGAWRGLPSTTWSRRPAGSRTPPGPR